MTITGLMLVTLFVFILVNAKSGESFGTFGFDVHHRYSDKVKDFMNLDGLPEKGTMDYYAAMAHRHHLFKARRLAGTQPPSSSVLTFSGGNDTYRISTLAFLHYSIVTVGTPGVEFLVALDTGSDLFWLPCDCTTTCVRSYNSPSGRAIPLNIYSPSASSTSSPVPCISPMCKLNPGCARTTCAYEAGYLSSNTSSTGILVEDVLHLVIDASPTKPVDVPVTLGCGMIQTGDFLDVAAVNGLFGLGVDSLSVPSILASKGLVPNSFSMCFGPDGLGRIDFGDKGSPDQKVTPLNSYKLDPTYNVTVTRITVGRNISNVEFTAAVDSGTSFTLLSDPTYTFIAESFDSQVTEQRYQTEAGFPFDYCYALSANQDTYFYPDMNLTMGGGNQLYLNAPTFVFSTTSGGYVYCLAIMKSEDINIIGQNFMTGYRVVFDREKMVLGWKESDCYGTTPSDDGANSTNHSPPTPSSTPPSPRATTRSPPPPSTLEPEATPPPTPAGTRVPPSTPPPPPPPPTPSLNPLLGSKAIRLNSNSNKFLMVLFSYFLLIA